MAIWIYNDGGREAAGFKGDAGDCVTRSIAIATGKPYREVYDALFDGIRKYKTTHRDRAAKRMNGRSGNRGTTPRNGVSRKVSDAYLKSIGWYWHPTMSIGSGCKVHLMSEELPKGNLIVRVSRHMVAVIDGIINDTFDPTREGTRCVYGYWSQAK